MATLFVATNGGHLAQLADLAPRLEPLAADRFWVTFDTPQGRSLLAAESHAFIPYIAERDVKGVARAAVEARRLLARLPQVTRVVSTGSAIALSFLPLAVLRGLEAHYIESAARVAAPSLTGRLMQLVPGVRRYRQYPHMARGGWRYGGSVFDGFVGEAAPSRGLRRLVVTVGSDKGFRRLVERIAAIVPRGVEVVWQTGATPVADLAIDAKPFLPAAALDRAMQDADAVVAHAGCGSALAALKAGKLPILVPREPGHGEVVDDHQIEIARWLSRQGLALGHRVEELTLDAIESVTARRVVRPARNPRFELAPAA